MCGKDAPFGHIASDRKCKNVSENHVFINSGLGCHLKVLHCLNTARVLGIIFQIHLEVGKHGLTFADPPKLGLTFADPPKLSKPDYVHVF